jgi:tetratricopeptide (TPR) repeat protein
LEWIERFRDGIADRYALGPEIGAGGMGAVYRAEDLKHGRPVAIKVLRPDWTRSVAGTRFLREIEISARLAHPNIVPVFDSGRVEDTLYYVMPLVEGESLRSLLDREGPLPPERAADLAREVADGLAYAHEHGVIHRDIKPSNIVLSGKHALIVDFGIARALEVAAPKTLTRSGDMIGTPVYMSPEQLLDGQVDGRSDIYALGCVLVEMLTGHPPLAGKTPSAIMASHVRGAVDPAELAKDLPEPLGSVVRCALEREPDDRFASAEDLVEVLGAAGSRGTGTIPMARGARARVGPVQAALAAAVVLVAAWGVWQLVAGPSASSADPNVFAVLPYPTADATPEEVAFLTDAAAELTSQLNRWETVRAVPSVSMTGAMFDLGLEGPAPRRAEDGRRVAEAVGAGRLVMLEGRFRDGDVALTAAIQSVDDGRTSSSVETSGSTQDLTMAVTPITHALLGIDGAEASPELWRQSSNPDAVRAYRRGVRHLEASRLGEAESELRTAVELDSTFALAHHRLALTLYWRWSTDETARSAEIPQLALTSVRSSGGLPARDSLHIEAFYRFQEGDYEQARTLYERLLDSESDDVYAWLMLGIVEYKDPWLREGQDGALVPRGSLNRALEAFSEATRLNPGFHLGYGHLFDIGADVMETAEGGGARGFHRPRSELVAPWIEVAPQSMEGFLPVNLDSIVWVDRPTFDALDDRVVEEGSGRVWDRSMAMLGRWVSFAPDEPRPREELADWTASRRSALSGSTRRDEARRLASVALAQADTALMLRTDTSVSNLSRIARLQLGAGRPDDASETFRAVMLLRGETSRAQPMDRSDGNIPMARGRLDEAIDLLELVPVQTWTLRDPESGEFFDDGGADAVLDELRALGAGAADRAALDDAFSRLSLIWSETDYSERQLRQLRSVRVRPAWLALARSPEHRIVWRDVLTTPVWALLDGSIEPTEAEILAADSLDRSLLPGERTFLLGGVAQTAGFDELAVRLWTRLDSLVYAVDSWDSGWALEPLSHLLRSRSHERLGDAAGARAHMDRFLEMWPPPHPPVMEAIIEGHEEIVAYQRDR